MIVNSSWRSTEVKYPEDVTSEMPYVSIYPYDAVSKRVVEAELIPLTDDVLQELRNKRVNPINIHDRILRDPRSIRHAKTWSVYGDWTIGALAYDLAKNWGIRLRSRETGLSPSWTSSLARRALVVLARVHFSKNLAASLASSSKL